MEYADILCVTDILCSGYYQLLEAATDVYWV